MDWIRRNWPDLLIGVALVAVIAMIVATLLSGGSLTSLLRRNTAPDIPITNTTGATNGGQTTTTPDDTAGTTTPDNATQAQTTPGSGTTSANGANGATGGNATQSGDLDVFVPGTTDAPDTATQDGATATPENAAGQNPTTTDDEGVGTATTPAGAEGVNAPLPESVINGGFRVAAGAVDSREGALAAAQTFRDAGYTVTVEPQGDLYLLWIGPYASDAGAERVVSQLQADGLVPDALVYTYDPDEADVNAENTGPGNGGTVNAASGTPAAQTGNAGAGNVGAANANAEGATTTPATAADALTPPAGQRFLQVGAYRSDESAAPQRTQLEGLGLSVTSDEDDSGIVRLYVGPFAAAQLAQTQNRLSSQGIDSFPVTP